jgi:para-aminobenzoate synthetase component 1
LARLEQLEYFPDSTLRFRSLLDEPWCAFLDSSATSDFAGRYDILACGPYATVTADGAETRIAREGRDVETSARDPLTVVQELLGETAESVPGLPFAGGAIGYFAYDLGRRFEPMEARAARDVDTPDLAVALYDWAVVVDHAAEKSWLVGQGRDARTFRDWDRLRALADPRPAKPRAPFRVLSAVTSNLSKRAYAHAFDAVKRHIQLGNCYQVNLTRRFSARAAGDPWDAYLALRSSNPAPFSAYLGFPGGSVLSSSPERFLRVDGRKVETKPIKGTRRRSPDTRTDRALMDELRASAKDRAENVMIVDLLRNDLGKSCVPGSVRVESLFDVESYASVHHLVSTVTGELDPARSRLDLLRGCFPGGSITGAPKPSAMQIIEALEPHRRGIYCGSIGYLSFDGGMDLNIAIRTLLATHDSIHAWAGGGIVADSELEAEYQESCDKAAALLAVLNRPLSAAS